MPKQKKSASSKKSVGSRIIDKVESRADVVSVAKAGGVNFAEVDVGPASKSRKKNQQTGGNKIVPAINYVTDECDDDV
ncbi:MAG: hypothetical protein ACXABY_25985 [Candidatus Thorarchaeota archaeon]